MKRMGGISIEGVRNTIQNNDVFVNPIHGAQIFEYLKDHFTGIEIPIRIFDACCGHGALGVSLYTTLVMQNFYESRYIEIDFMDVVDYKSRVLGHYNFRFTEFDVLDYIPKQPYDIIVCNPPWVPVELPERIFHHLISMLSDDGVLFFLINNTFCYQGIDRAKNLLFQHYYFLPRFTFSYDGRPLLDCGIMVYHKKPKNINLNSFIPLSRIKGEKK